MRKIIIGIDGVPYRLMEKFSDNGIMPNFAELRKNGIFKKMESTIPEISSISWSSIITGKNPGEHGIFGFTDMIPGTYSLSFPNFNALKAPPFWNTHQGKYVIINVPSTYPAKEMNGFLVSGFVALDLEKSIYPKEYVEKLEKMDYRIDVDAEKGHKSKLLFLKDLFDTLDKRMELCRYMWNEFDWSTFMFVFTGSDRIGHFLWDAYEDENHKHHQDFLNFFRKIDEGIGWIVSHMKPDDQLLMLSDHGMELSEVDVNVNNVLSEHGLLKLGNDPKKRYNNIEDGTKAFALDPGRIYLNKKGKYPKSCVEGDELLDKIKQIFEELERNGKKVIKKVYKKDELYQGPYTENAPDLILLANSGFNLRGSIGKQEVFSKDIFTGKHNQDDAFLFVKGKNAAPENPKVTDVLDILDSLS